MVVNVENAQRHVPITVRIRNIVRSRGELKKIRNTYCLLERY